MDPKYKTIIPLIVVFFILGVVVGYVAHKSVTIEKIVTVTVTPVPTPSPTTPIPPPTPTQTPTATPTPVVSDFTVKDYYDPSKDTPAKTIELTSRGADPNTLSIRPGDTVLIKITNYGLDSPLTLVLNATYSRNLGTSGAVVVTFNTKGTYSFKAIIPSGDPNVLPRDYAVGTITVY